MNKQHVWTDVLKWAYNARIEGVSFDLEMSTLEQNQNKKEEYENFIGLENRVKSACLLVDLSKRVMHLQQKNKALVKRNFYFSFY